MSDVEVTAEEIQLDISEARELVEMRDAFNRLADNIDFKKVILQGYFKDEAARLVEARGNPHLQKPEDQAKLLRSIDGIAEFKSYILASIARGNGAEQAIKAGEEALAEMAEEGDL